MKDVLIILFVGCVLVALGQNNIPWTTRARVRHHTEFFTQVMQETIYELERRGFSSMSLPNITQNMNQPFYKWYLNGTTNYTNGFLVSMQKVDVTTMTQSIGVPVIDGIPTPRATVAGRLNMRDVKLGYDVFFFDINGPVHKFTGDYTHVLIDWHITIQKHLINNHITVSMTVGTSGNLIRMVYRPANNITEGISRFYTPNLNAPGIRTWSTVLESVILDVIKNKVPFPEVCYNHC